MPLSLLIVSRLLAVGGVCVMVVACGPRAHCAGEHPYQEAETVSALQNVDDIQVPRSPSALQIPSVPEDREYPPYAELVNADDGASRIRCLDSPPRLPEVTVGGESGASSPDEAG